MFSRLGFFLFGFLVGGAAVMGSLRYHVDKAEDGTHLIPKMSATLSETYIDIREFRQNDWLEHPQLAAAVVRADKAYLMKEAAVGSLFQGAEDLLRRLGN